MEIKKSILIAAIVIIAGVVAFLLGSYQPPTGHEQLGEPNKSYLGLADVFKKPTDGVSTRNVDLEYEGVKLSGFLAQPSKEGKYPGIVMIHEWWGLNDQVKSMAHVLASEGYVVFAIDLFEGKVATTIPEAQANIRNNPNEKTLPKLQVGVKYLRSRQNVDSDRIASLGWCYGGGQSFLLGASGELQATVIYYGQVSTEKEAIRNLKEPVIGFFGAKDSSIPVETVREFENALKAQGTGAEIYVYENAGHGFANPTNTQAFRKDEATEAWAKTLDFLERNLKG